MRHRSVDRPVDNPPGFKELGTRRLRFRQHSQFPKTRRGKYTGDIAFDALEVQAWPKGTEFLGQPASLPERRVIWWLLHRAQLTPGVEFEFQPDFLGGRILRGGLVADFGILTTVPGMIVLWEVEGETWHRGRWRELRDEARRAKLLTFPEVFAVLSLKEIDINRSDRSRDEVCEMAMRLQER